MAGFPTSSAIQAAHRAIDEAAPAEMHYQWAALAKALVTGYAARWADSFGVITLDEVERIYVAPLVNPETTKESRTWRLGGKIDKLIRDDYGISIYDHKTTSQDIHDPDSTYWRQLVIEGQPSHYQLLLWANGVQVSRVVWDVARKPGIRPKKVSKAARTAILSLGEYLGEKVSKVTQREMEHDERENSECFQIRATQEICGDLDRYFQRRSAVRIDDELVDYAGELWEMGKEIRQTQLSKRHFRNAGACMTYGTPCRFLGICSNHDTPTSDKWKPKEHIHPELDGSIGTGEDLLTNSRIRCYQTCRRKHYYEYEMGIERVEEEEKESIAFGTLWHTALDCLWTYLCEGDLHGESSGKPASEVDRAEQADQKELAF